MKKVFGFYLIWLLLAGSLLLVGSGCAAGADGDVVDSIQQEVTVDSEEAQYILGKWSVDDGRFGNKIFDFGADGRLQLEDAASGEMSEMAYQFVGENSLILSGDEAFNGAATVNFFEDKMDMTITFEGNIFGELYLFTRVAEPSE